MALLKKKTQGKKLYVHIYDKNKISWCGGDGWEEWQLLEWKNHTKTRNTALFATVVSEGWGSGFVFLCIFHLKKQKWVLLIMRSKRNIQWLILTQYFSLPNLDGAFVCLKIMLAMLITCCCCCCLNEMEPFYHPGSSATTLQHLLSRLPAPSTMSAQWHPQQTGQH